MHDKTRPKRERKSSLDRAVGSMDTQFKRLGPVKSAILAGAAIVTAVGVITGGIEDTADGASSVWHAVFPEPTPTPNPTPIPTPTPSPGLIRARISDVTIVRSMTLGDYCDYVKLPCEEYTDEGLKTDGLVIQYTVSAQGYQDKDLPLTWTVVDANTNDPLGIPALTNQPGWPQGVFRPSGPDDENTLEIWVVYPQEAGSYFVELTLRNDLNAGFPPIKSEAFNVN